MHTHVCRSKRVSLAPIYAGPYKWSKCLYKRWCVWHCVFAHASVIVQLRWCAQNSVIWQDDFTDMLTHLIISLCRSLSCGLSHRKHPFEGINSGVCCLYVIVCANVRFYVYICLYISLSLSLSLSLSTCIYIYTDMDMYISIHMNIYIWIYTYPYLYQYQRLHH